MSIMNWLENASRTFRGARGSQQRSPARGMRSRRLTLEAFEDRIALSGLSAFVDPDPAPGNNFGETVVALSTGNVVITSPNDNAGGTAAGAVYLFDGATGALISTLTGSHAGDHVGSGGVTTLSDGNYVVSSPMWGNGAAASAGAVTWGNGTAGVSGAVSATNSLIGSTTNDSVGGFGGGVTALSNGNYVVSSPNWSNGAAGSAGAVTWGSGTAGLSGVVSATNSLVGSTANDDVGGGVTPLANGNYVVSSPAWSNGAAGSAGAVTWGSGTAGVSGAVSDSNSLVGSTANDGVGDEGVAALTNGNYVVVSFNWTNGAADSAGAVTWGSGTAGVTGVVSAANSLVGSKENDSVGSSGVTALTNGNYVVDSPDWTNGAAANAGAVTWGSGTAGVSGAVSDSNSLVGSRAHDGVGDELVTALTNGNYVVNSSFWNNGAATSAGAITWGSGTAGITGAVSAANSLVGTTASDQIGFGGSAVTPLTNGNYVVSSPNWTNGAAGSAGAVTWGSGTAGITGAVSAANSLVGTTTNDQVGGDMAALGWGFFNSVTALSNGNYVVDSPIWNNGAVSNAGAVTWGNGTAGITGAVSAANSLVGSTANDSVGSSGVTALTNGNYVVSSPGWNNGAATEAGAVTWGNGTTGVSGPVSTTSSLVGSTANDLVGAGASFGVTALSSGNYVVSSPYWTNGAAANAGAVTWGSGTAGVSGAVSATNSLIGSSANDSVGSSGATALANGNYVVGTPNWSNGAAANAGAVTLGSGTAGVSGVISTTNSLVGSVANSGLRGIALDDANGTFIAPFLTDGGGRVRVESQAPGSAPAQTITFSPLPDRTFGDAPFTVSASASSMLPVSYSIVGGSAYASISGTTVTIHGVTPAGTVVTVEANQAGNGSYGAAPPVDRSFTIKKATSATAPSSTPTPAPPQVLGITGVSSKKGRTSFTVGYNETLSASSASSAGLYQVFAAVSKIVKRHKVTLFTKGLPIRSVSPNSTSSAVTIKLAKPVKGRVEVMVEGSITAGNGASSNVRFIQDL